MGGTWRSEDFAGKAIFQLNCLTVDDDLLGPGRRPVARAAIGHVCGKKSQNMKAHIGQTFYVCCVKTHTHRHAHTKWIKNYNKKEPKNPRMKWNIEVSFGALALETHEQVMDIQALAESP